jgi:dTDP-4-dehydrorhamnose reductase
MKSPILLLGKNGYLAGFFLRYFQKNSVPHLTLMRSDLDFSQPALLRDFCLGQKPSLVINCAGFTGKPNVDACETQREACRFGNVTVPVRIAEVCRDLCLPLAQISSGCIYQGSRDPGDPFSGFREDDPPNFCFSSPPCSFYSGTKAEMEDRLRGFPQLFIWRLRMPFWHVDEPRNLLSKLIRYPSILEGRNSLSQAEEFVSAALRLWEKRAPFGTYNVCNPGSILTSGILAKLTRAGIRQSKWQLYADEGAFFQEGHAPRSACVLDTSKLQSCGISLQPVEEALDAALARWRAA